MSIVMQINPYEFFTDTNGDALDAGYIWVGEANKDPRQYPVTIYFDAAMTIPVAMPLRTSNGYIVRNGSPTFLYINGNYSIMVLDNRGRQIFYVPDFLMISTGMAVTSGDLANSTDPAKGAALVGMMGFNLYDYLRQNRVPIESFGAVGDYNPDTLVGTDNTAAFALAIASGLKIQLKRNAKYMITGDTIVQSGMDWYGDENYSPEIYPKFSSSGKIMLRTPLSGPVIENVSVRGITFARIGQNAEHGILVDNFDGFNLDVKVTASPTALGGAICIAGIYPFNKPSRNGTIKSFVDYGGNFGVQIGNLDIGTVEVQSTNSMREVIGLEPQALARFDFTQSNVAADIITIVGHGLTTGYPLLYSPQSNASIPALTRPDYWFAIVVDSNRIKLASSKELALGGVNVSLGAFSGTHVLLKCGICRDVVILPSNIDVGDVPVAGTLTGVVDFTSASGGYHEGITVNPITVVERNPTSGSHGIFIAGAHNITVNDFQSIGCKLTGALVDIAFVNNVFAESGNIAPSPAMGCRPKNIIMNNPVVREFKLIGINVRDGECEVRGAYAHSELGGITGLQLGSSATLRNSRIINSIADCPNGTGLNLGAFDGNNRDLNVVALRNRKITRVNEQSLFKSVVGAPNPVVGLTSQSGAVSTYAGQLYVLARNSTTESANVAAYWLDIMLQTTGGVPVVAVVHSSGLTGGTGASSPSFTFSIDGSNNLVATPVGSTSTTATWNFYINAVGDLALT